MSRRIAVIFAVSIILATAASAVEAPLPRHPAPSPDGSQIAFSWQGDLWLVPAAGGDARRLTAHPAIERYPVWSRDGKFLAFASSRHGNVDVFVMPVDGSAAPVRLTFASTVRRARRFHPRWEGRPLHQQPHGKRQMGLPVVDGSCGRRHTRPRPGRLWRSGLVLARTARSWLLFAGRPSGPAAATAGRPAATSG